MQLNVDDFSTGSEGPSADARVNAAMELPPELRGAEVATAVLRQYVARHLPQGDALVLQVDAAFPRTQQSLSNKSVVTAVLGMTLGGKHETLIEMISRSVLEGFASSGAPPDDVRVAQVRTLPYEHQIYELSVALLRQHISVKQKVLPAAAGMSALFDQRFPKSANAIGKAAVLTALTQQEAPQADSGLSILEAYLINHITYRDNCGATVEKVMTQNFEYKPDDTVEINGFRVSDQQPGQIVRGLDDLDFANAVVLGRGAGGSVMKVRCLSNGYTFAVKEILLSEESMEQAKNEVQVVWGSAHAPVQERCASLIDCYGVFYKAITLYIVMELLDGSLKDLEKRRRAVDEAACCAIAFQALQGLRFLHDVRRQLHRDIKPHNILYRAADGAVKIADFGISSKVLETIANFKSNTYCGTTLYMSPQRIAGEAYGYEGDIWSFGVTMLELAMGSLPWQGTVYEIDALRQRPPRLPQVSPFGAPFSPEFQDFIAQCCNPVVGPHYPTAAHLLQHPFLRYMTWEDSRRIAMNFGR